MCIRSSVAIQHIEVQVREYLAHFLDVNVESVALNYVIDDSRWDSFAVASFVFHIESTFNVKVSVSDMLKLSSARTVRAISLIIGTIVMK